MILTLLEAAANEVDFVPVLIPEVGVVIIGSVAFPEAGQPCTRCACSQDKYYYHS